MAEARETATIVDPVDVEEGMKLKNATLGSTVAVGAGAVIENSTLKNTIIASKSRIVNATLSDSLVGDEVVIEGFTDSATVVDHSEIRG